MLTDKTPQNLGEGMTVATEAALKTSLRRLRFDAPLEAAFRDDFERDSLPSRLLILVLSIVSVALTPVYDVLFLHPPAAFVPISRLLQFGVQIPGLLLALIACLPSLRRALPAAMVLATITVTGGLFLQRMIGAEHGYVVPFGFAAITIAAVYALGRLRFTYFFPWSLLIVVAVSGAELRTFGVNSEALYNCLSLSILFAMLSAGGYVLERTTRENWYRRRQLSMLALHDPLTGLPNRRHFDRTLVQLIRAAARERGNVALMVLDIDEFKAYNDCYGHPAGDVCLSRIGEWLSSQMRRPRDFCARIGGEEFVAVWVNAKPADARRLAEDLRAGIAALAIPHKAGGEAQVVTASGGFVEVIAPQPEAAAHGIAKLMLRRADDLLYQGKHAGRDRLIAD